MNLKLFRSGSINGLLVSIAVGASLHAATLNLETYLNQVETQNKGVQSMTQSISALQSKSDEKDLLTTPILNASAFSMSERKTTSFSGILGTQTYTHSGDISVKWQLDNGLALSTGYQLAYYSFPEASTAITVKEYGEGIPYIQATLPLWKNKDGQLTKATRDSIGYTYDSAVKSNEFGVQSTLVAAETAYWRLVLSREAVTVATDATERAKKMMNWASSRQALALGDKSDFLQAKALLQLRQLELQSAKDDVRSAERAFNTARGKAPQTPIESLESLDDTQLNKIKCATVLKNRKDIDAALAAVKAARAKATAEVGNYDPTLNLIGQFKLNQYDPSIGNAVLNTLSTAFPTLYIGLQYSSPIDSKLIDTIKSGTQASVKAAELDYQQKLFTQKNEWIDLQQRLSDAQQRLDVVKELESIQLAKWKAETDRHQKGRTTMAQVLLFEQDYANAQLIHLRTKAELLLLSAQLKLFGS
jgi:outer membrane protein TolC